MFRRKPSPSGFIDAHHADGSANDPAPADPGRIKCDRRCGCAKWGRQYDHCDLCLNVVLPRCCGGRFFADFMYCHVCSEEFPDRPFIDSGRPHARSSESLTATLGVYNQGNVSTPDGHDHGDDAEPLRTSVGTRRVAERD